MHIVKINWFLQKDLSFFCPHVLDSFGKEDTDEEGKWTGAHNNKPTLTPFPFRSRLNQFQPDIGESLGDASCF